MVWIGLWALGALIFGLGYSIGANFARTSVPDTAAEPARLIRRTSHFHRSA